MILFGVVGAAEQDVTLSTPFRHMSYREAISKVRHNLAQEVVERFPPTDGFNPSPAAWDIV